MPKPLAHWNSARDVWEIPATEGLFCEHSDVWSETWPTSVMWDASTVYELPTWEERTDASGSSSAPLLKTPQASENSRGRPHRYLNSGEDRRFDLSDQIAALFPPDSQVS